MLKHWLGTICWMSRWFFDLSYQLALSSLLFSRNRIDAFSFVSFCPKKIRWNHPVFMACVKNSNLFGWSVRFQMMNQGRFVHSFPIAFIASVRFFERVRSPTENSCFQLCQGCCLRSPVRTFCGPTTCRTVEIFFRRYRIHKVYCLCDIDFRGSPT